jgi:uncharacterized protein YprB with RNaseH-like and TPR domain
MATAQISWGARRRVWAFDIEARPGPWGGGDFTFKHMLSIAGGFEGERIEYLAPGFTAGALEDFLRPLRHMGPLVVTHNGIRYDLPLLNGMMVKLGLAPLPPMLVCDTYAQLVKRGQAFSASLGNMAQRFGIQAKGGMSEYAWERVYEGDPEYLEKLRTYNIGDVETTLELRAALIERKLLKPARVWRP